MMKLGGKMRENKYLLRVKHSYRGGEVGHIYMEVQNVSLPDGMIAYEDMHSSDNLFEVHPRDEVEYITYSQYEAINEKIENKEDPSDIVESIIEEIEKAEELQRKLAAFKLAALELGKLWNEVPYDCEVLAKMDSNYPFEGSNYEDVLKSIQRWGTNE